MDQDYVIVRTPRGLSRGGPGPAPAGAPGVDELDIEHAELSAGDRRDVARDPRTMAMAAAMPMRLIAPVEETDEAVPSDAAPTWGVEAVGAIESPFDGSGVTVAILDTGIDPDHPAFAGVDLELRNFSTEGDIDTNGHGTHCAGTVFGQDVEGSRIGVARSVDRALIGKVLGEGASTSAIIAEAIQWAVSEGAHVISMSLGIDFPGYVDFLVGVQGLDVNPATSVALVEYRRNINLFGAVAAAVRAQGAFGDGTVIVAASGNESRRPDYEIAVAPPAAGEGLIACGALGQGNSGHAVADFSNTEVDVSAPGVGVISAQAGGALTAKSGTSMATPHVAGVAALWAQKILEARGGLDAEVLTAQLIANADIDALAPDSDPGDVGTGIVRAPLR